MYTEGSYQAKLDELVAGLAQGKPTAVGRAISLLEQGGQAASILRDHLPAARPDQVVVGITGPPGAGKSSLISTLIGCWRARDKSVAIIAIDPSSPVSGGSVLGDRARMGAHSGDPNVFIRSLSTAGRLGGLNDEVDDILAMFQATPFDIVVLETVGAGQSETEVAEIADVCIVATAPGLGDGLQAIKAGILEIADILVVNKSDLPGANATRGHLASMLKLRDAERREVPVLTTNAVSGEGVGELADLISEIGHSLDPQVGLQRAAARFRLRIARAAGRHAEALVAGMGDEAFESVGESVGAGNDIMSMAEALLYEAMSANR